MKKILFAATILAAMSLTMHALEPQKTKVTVATEQPGEKYAEIRFDTLTHDFGSFKESEGVVSCEFGFTNVGSAPLVIHQAISSCGCTAPDYTKSPVKPGERGVINVVYSGKGRFPGKFRKVITVRYNSKNPKEAVNLFIQGNMLPDEKEE
ncbi:MAG: DUF1573 domain-containing protein [Bacteroidaceae bacterium]|nr:DUF1573 domain-containing protein [Bacteroidaceae bacterium]